MRIGKVIGSVTLSQSHPSLHGGRFPIVVPLSLDNLTALDNLTGSTQPDAEELVAYDDLGAGVGTLIALSEGGEAAQPFYPTDKPIDAYNAAILDEIRVVPLNHSERE